MLALHRGERRCAGGAMTAYGVYSQQKQHPILSTEGLCDRRYLEEVTEVDGSKREGRQEDHSVISVTTSVTSELCLLSNPHLRGSRLEPSTELKSDATLSSVTLALTEANISSPMAAAPPGSLPGTPAHSQGWASQHSLGEEPRSLEEGPRSPGQASTVP